MNDGRVFYVVLVEDRSVQRALDAIRFICDPSQKYRAHITVRGPYRQRYKLPSAKERFSHAIIEIDGPGSFFEGGQNTVFLTCDSEALRETWFKPDYAYAPHLTLYDGRSRELAERLLSVAQNVRLRCQVRSTQLIPLISRTGQSGFGMEMDLRDSDLQEAFGEHFSVTDVKTMSDDDRVRLFESGLRRLSLSCVAPQGAWLE